MTTQAKIISEQLRDVIKTLYDLRLTQAVPIHVVIDSQIARLENIASDLDKIQCEIKAQADRL